MIHRSCKIRQFLSNDTKKRSSVTGFQRPLCCSFCPIACLRVFNSIVWCPLRCPGKKDVRFVLTPICFVGFTLQVFINAMCIYLAIVYCCPTGCSHQMIFASVEQELLVLTEQLSSFQVFVEFVMLSLQFFVMCSDFVDHLFVLFLFCLFHLHDHCNVYT